MRISIALLATASLSLGCGGKDTTPPTPSSKQQPVEAPESKPQELADEYDLGDYRIRPPKGFEVKSDDEIPRGAGRLVVWRSVEDQRGFSVALIILPKELTPATPEKIRVFGRSKGMTDVEESAPERETLAGLVFEKCTTEYTFRNTDKKYSSIVYSYANGSKGILITYSCPVGEDEDRLRIATMAIRSFRKP